MIRRILPPICVTLVTCLAGCSSEDPSTEAQSVQSVSSAAHELSFALVAKEYRGGEVEKHWHLTTWTLKNDSCEHIAEAVVVVSLFDHQEAFLGHHAVTFQHILPGEKVQQQRLLFLKSDTIEQWRPRCESVQTQARGDLTGEFRLTLANVDQHS